MPDEKPYHAKRPHRKSRAGCISCKQRRVKCSEDKPRCRACTLRKEDCRYPSATSAEASGGHQRSPSTVRSEDNHDSSAERPRQRPATGTLVSPPESPADSEPEPFGWELLEWEPEPDPLPAPVSELMPPATFASGVDDMKLMWFYTVRTFTSFSVEAGFIPDVYNMLTITIPQYALGSPFLLNALLAVSAFQMDAESGDKIPESRIMTYRTKAVQGYRRAVVEARPETFPALIVSSLFLCVLSSQDFREPDAKPFFILDWIVVWRGIGIMTELVTRQTLVDTGLFLLFSRPRTDRDEGAMHTPGNLLFMVSSIPEGDPDCEFRDSYYDTIKVLGALYMDLKAGYGPVMELRIITFFTFLPRPFVEAARLKRPRALVIIAYWLAFSKLSRVWWMQGIARNEICHIDRHVGDEWAALMQVPLAANKLDDATEIGRLLLGNHAWTPVEHSLSDLAADKKPALVYDDGGLAIDVLALRRFGNKPQ
ncbi:hypothetical protein RB594_004292 [Gaeumannomyces avenae]